MDSLCHPCITTAHLSYTFLSLKLPPPPLYYWCNICSVNTYLQSWGILWWSSMLLRCAESSPPLTAYRASLVRGVACVAVRLCSSAFVAWTVCLAIYLDVLHERYASFLFFRTTVNKNPCCPCCSLSESRPTALLL